MQKLLAFIFRANDDPNGWIIRMRKLTKQIGPRYQTGLFTVYRLEVSDDL